MRPRIPNPVPPCSGYQPEGGGLWLSRAIRTVCHGDKWLAEAWAWDPARGTALWHFWRRVSPSIRPGNAGSSHLSLPWWGSCQMNLNAYCCSRHLPTTMRRQKNLGDSDTHSGFVDPQNNPRLVSLHSPTPTHPFWARRPTPHNPISSGTSQWHWPMGGKERDQREVQRSGCFSHSLHSLGSLTWSSCTPLFQNTSSVEDFSHPPLPLVSGNMISFPGHLGLEEAIAPSSC